MSWAERLKAEREKRGLRQQDCAYMLGVTEMTWSRWERGEREPTSRLVLKALEAEGWPVPARNSERGTRKKGA